MQQMTALYDKTGYSVLGVEDVLPNETASYGIVDVGGEQGDACEVKSIVEKPKPEDAPSTLAVVGRYVLTPKIFDLLENVQ